LTSNVIGGAEKPEPTLIFHNWSRVVSSNAATVPSTSARNTSRATGRERAAIIRVVQVHALLDFAGQRVGGLQVTFPPVGGGTEAAIPASLLAVLSRSIVTVEQFRQSRMYRSPVFEL